ncbi:MAG TPA: hypothetical protein VE439_11815 [Anaerolineae bacterium]|jgi:nitrate reductase gamma subunit|nr:hypothetical protein [Anaerolineae bacterium]
MSVRKLSPVKVGFLTFISAFVLGLIIFLIFGQLAGIFSPGKDLIDTLIGSPAGWVAVFGATLIIFSPIIGLTIWAVNRAINSVLDQSKK